MLYAKQQPALEAHDKSGGIVVAEDISGDGHKRYRVLPRADVLRLRGPFNELIREKALCRLYFDLDGDSEAIGNDPVRELIDQVCTRLYDVYTERVNPRDIIVLCSSNERKYSKHIIFPVVFKNNWSHMRNFVRTIDHPLVDGSVYSRNRCFRMAGCWKYAEPSRVFIPDTNYSDASDSLIQIDQHLHPLEFVDELMPEQQIQRTQTDTPRYPNTPFAIEKINVPDDWKPVLNGLEPDDLLMAIHPNQEYGEFFAVGCAYKKAGGSFGFFWEWCKDWRGRPRVLRQWRGWNKCEKTYGYPFLKRVALHSSTEDECSAHLNEAFGFDPDCRTTHFNSTYLHFAHLTKPERCVLVKSRTGSGKSTVARTLARQYANKRILYLVSSRPLAYAARDSLNRRSGLLGQRNLNFVSYLETDQPLCVHKHLCCSIQSLWRAFRINRKPYALIIVDEITSVIEDMTNTTNKHPKENQQALRWFAERCEKWVGLDAHLMNTSVVLCQEYFKENIRVLINHSRGARKDAVLIPKPQWTRLARMQDKACSPNASDKEINDFSDATILYDLMFQCWAQGVKTFFICNNVRLGNWFVNNYLKRSFTWMALMHFGLPDALANLVTDFCCKGDNSSKRLQRRFKYAWIFKSDGRTNKDFKNVDWWADIDHLQYTLKICQGVDFNPPEAHYGIGFCYTSPNTAVPRRILQQEGRNRKYAPNPIREHPTMFFAINTTVTVKHLPVCGLTQIEKYADDQEFFMKTVVQHHSVNKQNYLSWFFKPEPVWRKLYIMVMNERETFLRYPLESYKWWLRHDGWSISNMIGRPKPMLQWKTQRWTELASVEFDEIPLLEHREFLWLEGRRNRTGEQTMQVKKFKFLQTFDLPDVGIVQLWNVYNDHPGWVYNTLLERFSNFEAVIQRRWGKLIQTQHNTEWMDMIGARLIIVQKIASKLGLADLWNSNGAFIYPQQYANAQQFVQQNVKKIDLSFGLKDATVGKILKSWGGHKISVHLRIRKRNGPSARPSAGTGRRAPGDYPDINCPVEEFVESMGDRLPEFTVLYGSRLLEENIRAFLLSVRNRTNIDRPAPRMDESIRKIQSIPWNLLRPSAISP